MWPCKRLSIAFAINIDHIRLMMLSCFRRMVTEIKRNLHKSVINVAVYVGLSLQMGHSVCRRYVSSACTYKVKKKRLKKEILKCLGGCLCHARVTKIPVYRSKAQRSKSPSRSARWRKIMFFLLFYSRCPPCHMEHWRRQWVGDQRGVKTFLGGKSI